MEPSVLFSSAERYFKPLGHIDSKILNRFSDMVVSDEPWYPANEPNPTRPIVLRVSDGSGNPNGDLVILAHGWIGGGAYGKAYRAIVLDRENREVPVVVKITFMAYSKPPQSFISELLAMRINSADPYCTNYAVCLYSAFRSTFGSVYLEEEEHRGAFYGIVMEEMDGDLEHLCIGLAPIANPTVTAEQRLMALVYIELHMLYDLLKLYVRGFMHNDVKPENFLYKLEAREGGDYIYRIKLSDFGLACMRRNINLKERIARTSELFGMFEVPPELMSDELPWCYAGLEDDEMFRVRMSQMRMIGCLELSTEFLRKYENTPVSKAISLKTTTIVDTMDLFSKALMYLQNAGIQMPLSSPHPQFKKEEALN
jgi:serine/threonine protein kinase